MPPTALLYSKEGCHLCEQAKAILSRLAAEGLLDWKTVDIQEDADLYERYWDKIPVVRLEDGRSWYGKISEFRLRRALEDPLCVERRAGSVERRNTQHATRIT